MKHPRSILITGASGGIGAALARAYAGPDIMLELTGRNAKRLEETVNSCRAAGAEVQSTILEITDAESVKAWIERVDAARPLDLVIANAGITGGISADGDGETLADVQRIMSINFGGVCNVLHPVIPSMRRRRHGQLALISSLAAIRGLPYSPAYCASKAALKAYGEALRGWLRPDGVKVSIVLPGFVDTRLGGHITGPKPFQMSPQRAARIIRSGLSRDRSVIAFPFLLHAGMKILAVFPAPLVDPFLNAVRVEIRRYE